MTTWLWWFLRSARGIGRISLIYISRPPLHKILNDLLQWIDIWQLVNSIIVNTIIRTWFYFFHFFTLCRLHTIWYPRTFNQCLFFQVVVCLVLKIGKGSWFILVDDIFSSELIIRIDAFVPSGANNQITRRGLNKFLTIIIHTFLLDLSWYIFGHF